MNRRTLLSALLLAPGCAALPAWARNERIYLSLIHI